MMVANLSCCSSTRNSGATMLWDAHLHTDDPARKSVAAHHTDALSSIRNGHALVLQIPRLSSFRDGAEFRRYWAYD